MRLYLKLFLAVIALGFSVTIALTVIGVHACIGCDLVKWQEYKARNARGAVDTIFLGDSSLGYALDAKSYSQYRGKLVLNLALSGWNYGIAGAYALLNTVLQDVRPKNVVIMLTPQDYIGDFPILIRGFVQTARNSPGMFFEMGPSVAWEVSKLLAQYAFDEKYLADGYRTLFSAALAGNPCLHCEKYQDYDYMAPRYEIIDTKSAPEVWQLPVTSACRPFFRRMAALCREHGLNCLYLHSTLFHRTAERNRDFILQLGKMVAEDGLSVPFDMPIMIPDSEIGNTINHIRPEMREVYTKRIHDLLATVLR